MLSRGRKRFGTGMSFVIGRARRGGIALAATAVLACGGDGTSSGAPTALSVIDSAALVGTGPAILFVGNSLTSSNNLPGRVERMSREAGTPVSTSGLTANDTSLGDHWANGTAPAAIRSRSWNAVVMQQGPSTLPESRADLIASATQYAQAIRAGGGRPALLMVWPLPGQTQAAVAASYRAAAEATNAVLIPAGDVWERVRAADPSVDLTIGDGYHPSALGSEIAAMATICALFPGSRPPAPTDLSPAARQAATAAACPQGRPAAGSAYGSQRRSGW